MTDGPVPESRRGSSLTVQGWQYLVLSIMGIVVLAGTIGGGLLVSRSDRGADELINALQPARVAAYQLQAALRDQETALRGYLIAADPQFLEPYYGGLRAEKAAADDIRQRVGGRSELLADLDAIERGAANWRANYAEPLIAGVRPGVPAIVDNATVERGRIQFDALRSLFDDQNAHLTLARTEALDELDGIRTWRDTVLAGLVTVFFIAAVVLAVMIRSAVTKPLGDLAAACRRITEGSFAETIPARGPKDIRGIANDVENMRQTIVAELESSRSARAKLAEQTDALDEQAVELRRSNAELEQFAYVASHDLQEPLRKVASFCQLLEKRYGDKLDERGTEYIGFAVDGAKRMQILINDLLTFSRVGRLNAMSTAVDLGDALDAALANVSIAVEETGAVILRPDTPLPTVTGDPTLLAMLWQNLIGNAMKFRRPDVAPRIVIELERTVDDDDELWRIRLSDNGIGIPEEFVDKVFVIFQRLHGRDAYAGTGIGLALCKKIVEHHGGTIGIDTGYTGGTRFCFTLPVASPEQPVTTSEGTP